MNGWLAPKSNVVEVADLIALWGRRNRGSRIGKGKTRLCGRYRTLTRSGKNTKLVCVAIARELAGFIWDIARHEMPRLAPKVA